MTTATKERIFQVADELDANGQNPTLAAVRKGLGGGSFTTISEAMTEWKAKKAAREKTLSEPAPRALLERFIDVGGEIWTLALELANGRLAGEREAFEAARAQYEAEKAEAGELADQVNAELEAMKGRVASLEAAERTALDDAAGLRERLAALSERAAACEARSVEIEKRAADLNAELSRVNQQNSELIKALAASASSQEPPEQTKGA